MKIDEINIVKFRSIFKSEISINKINAIVGENNAGKTAILRALNAFFNFEEEEKYFLDKTHQYAKRSNTKIIIKFVDIPNDGIFQNMISNDKINLEFSYSYSDNKKSLHYLKDGSKNSIDEKFMTELKKNIDFVYIPASRNNFDLLWSSKSVFTKFVSEFASKHTQNRDNISKGIKSTADKLQSTIITKVEKQIGELYMQNSNLSFKLDYIEPIEYSMLLGKLGIKVLDNGIEHSIKECGSGVKSLTVIALYRALAAMSKTSIILGIEEPETNLHPQAQKRLIDSLKKDLQLNEVQTIFATHSTVIIDELNHEDIIFVRREKDEARGFKSKVTQLKESFWIDNGIIDFKHYQFFKYRNSDFFFSKYVILTESPIDAQVIDRLIREELSEEIFDVSILNLNGVTNLKYPFFLLKNLGIPFSIVVDKDFFVPYKNDNKLDSSRNERTWLPLYADFLKPDNEVLNEIFHTQSKKVELLDKINGHYNKLFPFLDKQKIYTMNYCLDMDLSCSNLARERYYEKLNMMPAEHTQKHLLKDKFKAIKNAEKILSILDEIPKSSYPKSFLKIKNALIKNIKEVI